MPPGRAIVAVELTREELSALLVHAQTQHAELARVQEELESAEGESATQWNLLRSIRPQLDLFGDLAAKLEMAAREAGWR